MIQTVIFFLIGLVVAVIAYRMGRTTGKRRFFEDLPDGVHIHLIHGTTLEYKAYNNRGEITDSTEGGA